MMPRLLVVINTATREYGSVEKQQLNSNNSSNNSATMEIVGSNNMQGAQIEAEVKRVGESSIYIHSNNNERRLRNDDDELLGDDYK